MDLKCCPFLSISKISCIRLSVPTLEMESFSFQPRWIFALVFSFFFFCQCLCCSRVCWWPLLLVDGTAAHWWRVSTCFQLHEKFHRHHDSILEMSILHFVNFVQRQIPWPLEKARWPRVRPNDKKSIISFHRPKPQNVSRRLCSKFHAESFDVNFNFLSFVVLEIIELWVPPPPSAN